MDRTEQTKPDAVTQALAEPFEVGEVKFKPAVVSGNRAMAIAYVDARVIQDRLDEVLGVAGWQDEYECLPDGGVVCRLRLRLGDGWITKMDVGGPSEQPDEGDRRKAAFSDAPKRAAVKFGIGRYLYRLPSQWVDYDPQKRQFVRTPKLPPTALPRRPLPLPNAGRSQPAAAEAAPRPPANGMELRERLQKYEEQLVKQKRAGRANYEFRGGGGGAGRTRRRPDGLGGAGHRAGRGADQGVQGTVAASAGGKGAA